MRGHELTTPLRSAVAELPIRYCTVQMYRYKTSFVQGGLAEAVEVTAMLERVLETWTSLGDRETSGRRTLGRRYALLISKFV